MKIRVLIALAAAALVGCASQPPPSEVASHLGADTEYMARQSNRFPPANRRDTYSQFYNNGMRSTRLGEGFGTYSPAEFSKGHVDYGNWGSWNTGNYWR
jgi:hypothetical protein